MRIHGPEQWGKLYDRQLWRGPHGLRKAVLARDPVCMICHRNPATVADHKIPHRGNWNLFTDLAHNLWGICETCHSRRRGLPSARRTTAFVGGMLSGTFNAGPRTIRLEFFDWGIRLRGRGMGRLFRPVWEIDYVELREARLVTAPGNQGVRLRAGGDSADPMIFWTRRGSERASDL